MITYIARSDLTGGGFAKSWGQGWNGTNPSGYSDSLSGSGAPKTQTQHIVQLNGDSSIAITADATADFFDLDADSYYARFKLDATLPHDGNDSVYVLTLDGVTDTFL